MAALKFNPDLKLAPLTLAAIEAAVSKAADDGFRPHLGASLIGRSCMRSLWYSFRWATKAKFSARTLRLFARGQREEDVMAQFLRSAGMTIHQVDQSTGQQYRFSECGGHFGGSMDGGIHGVPDAPKTWHVWECKTSSKKMFDELERLGVKESKPEHWAQMQCYMKWTGMDRALYTSICKDDDRMHIERIDFDEQAADALITKAGQIIFSDEPPQRIGGPDWFECKWCDHFETCHGQATPVPTCRSCAHSTPEQDGTWSCAKYPKTLTVQEQKAGCIDHRFIPKTLEHWAELSDANHEKNWVEYKHIATGLKFVNGPFPEGFKSIEIHAASEKAALAHIANDESLMNLRRQYRGEVVE